MSKFRLVAVNVEDGTEVDLPSPEEIPVWLKRSRTDKDMSMQELGAIMGVSKQAVYLWETGETAPTLDRLIRLMEMFAVVDKPADTEPSPESLLLPHATNVVMGKAVK